MPKAVIKSTTSNRCIRITKDMGDLQGMPCGDTTLQIFAINKHMADAGSPAQVEVIGIDDRKIFIPVGEVDNVDGDTDVADLMKLYSAIKLACNMDDTP